MGLIVDPYSWSNGAANFIDADEVNLRFTRLYALVNGNIDAANIADAGVGSRELAPTTGLVVATSNLALTASYQDVPGASLSITPSVPSYLLVQATFYFALSSNTGSITADGTLGVDGTDQTVRALLGATTSVPGRATVSQVYRIPLTAAAHTIKLRAAQSGGALTADCYASGTQFLYTLIAQ